MPNMVKATLIRHDRFNDAFCNLVEMKIWSVPITEHTAHGVRYSLVYIVRNERVIGYDNERGKGDHKHIGGKQERYQFMDVDKLVDDFARDVEAYIRSNYES